MYFIFFFILFLSSLLSYDKSVAFKFYVKYLEILVLFIGILIHIDSSNNAQSIYKLYLTFTIIFAITGILIYLFPSFLIKLLFAHKKGLVELLPRNGSLMSNPNVYGVFSAIMCVTAMILLKTRAIPKLFGFITLTTSLFGIIASGSKNGIMTLCVSLCLLLCIMGKLNRKITVWVMSILIVFFFLWFIGLNRGGKNYKVNAKIAYNEFIYGTVDNRLNLWKGALNSFMENPVIGTGPYVYIHHHVRYTGGFGSAGFFNAHNIFLQALVESGLIGLAIFSSIFVLIYKLFKKRKFFIALPLLTFFIGQIFDCFLYDYFLNVYFVSLLSIAIFENKVNNADSDDQRLNNA